MRAHSRPVALDIGSAALLTRLVTPEIGSAALLTRGWSRWTLDRPPCGEHSRARKACARKRSLSPVGSTSKRNRSGQGNVGGLRIVGSRHPRFAIIRPGVWRTRCPADACWIGWKRSINFFYFGIEKCRSALGAARALAPSPPLGTSPLSAPNATDRQSDPQMGGACKRRG